MATAFLSHPACQAHLSAIDHPDCPERTSAVRDRLVVERLIDFLLEVEAPQATREQLERVHSVEHIDNLLSAALGSEIRKIDEDTFMDAATVDAALHAAGAVVHATDLVLGGKAANAFCNVRPPGHHATRQAAMGFCFFNNVAVGVAHALAEYDLDRVAVIDFDAHHGNGTEAIFRDDPRVLMCSVFERNLFPESQDLPGSRQAVNLLLEPGAGSEAMRDGIRQMWDPALREFEPEMVFVSAGFDGHIDDLISDLRWGFSDYRWISEYLFEIAEKSAGGRIVSTLEGGYEPAVLGRCAGIHIRTLMGL